jgi:hypothetical protein
MRHSRSLRCLPTRSRERKKIAATQNQTFPAATDFMSAALAGNFSGLKMTPMR